MKPQEPRVKHWGCENWTHVPNEVKAVHAVGRTSNLQPNVSEEEIAALEETFGTVWPMNSRFSKSQRLDLIATSIIRTGRAEERRVATEAGETLPFERRYLSPWQWWARSIREFPFDPEGLDFLSRKVRAEGVRHSQQRAEPIRLADRAWDRTGDSLNVVKGKAGPVVKRSVA